MRIKKPLIRQAGSAEAFVGSAAAGREHMYYTLIGKAGSRLKPIESRNVEKAAHAEAG
jgi:hypothetical protein